MAFGAPESYDESMMLPPPRRPGPVSKALTWTTLVPMLLGAILLHPVFDGSTLSALPPGDVAMTSGDTAPLPIPSCPDAPPTSGATSDAESRAAALVRAEALFDEGLTRAALACVEEVLDRTPRDPEALWRAASLAVALGVELDEAGRAGAEAWYRRAERWAVAAHEANPSGPEGRYWQMAVFGRMALSAGPREALELSDRILALGSSILAEHPDHAATHHALGRMHLEVMSRSGVSRFFGRTFLGGVALREASWDRAHQGLRRAVELEPERSMFHLDLGRYHLARGDRAAARRSFEAAIAAAGAHRPDRVFVDEARALLREVGS